MSVRYAYYKAIAVILRTLARPKLRSHPHPNEVIFIPARDEGRTIKAHIYKPAKGRDPSPVLINFCGSGFLLPTFGNDDEYCRFVADRTDYTIIDVQYRLAPENPFPAAFNDAEDVVRWVRLQPDRFDLSHLSLSGFSAGANIALAVSSSSSLFNQKEQQDVFHTVISFYGPTDMAIPTPAKAQADRSNWIMRNILPTFSHLCHKCLNLDRVDPEDPRLSPLFADPRNFPNNSLIITAAQCPFAYEGEELAEKIRNVEGKACVMRRMEGCVHGWDKEAVRGTSQCKAKDKAYALAVEVLQKGEEGAVKASGDDFLI